MVYLEVGRQVLRCLVGELHLGPHERALVDIPEYVPELE